MRMRKFLVNVNGSSYEVMVEEIAGVDAPAAAPMVTAAPVIAAAPMATAAPVIAPTSGATVSSPMPGNILDIKVKVGDVVKSGDVLLILEAMKMENEVAAPCGGTVKTINISKGAAVNTGDVLAVIE